MLAQQNQQNHTDKRQRNQKPAVAAIRKQLHVDREQTHTQQAPHHRAEKAIAAELTALVIAAAHAENSADTGKRRSPIQKIVDQRAQRGGQSGLDIPHTDFGEQGTGRMFLRIHGTLSIYPKFAHKKQQIR